MGLKIEIEVQEDVLIADKGEKKMKKIDFKVTF